MPDEIDPDVILQDVYRKIREMSEGAEKKVREGTKATHEVD